jgi:hypothetical protein
MRKVHYPHGIISDGTRCGIYNSWALLTDDPEKVTCKRCLINLRHKKELMQFTRNWYEKRGE